MNIGFLTLGAFGQNLTGNGWVDSIIILGGLCAIALLLKKVKDEFFPKADKPLKLSPSPLKVEEVKKVATKEDIAEVKEEIDKIWDEVKGQREISRNSLSRIHLRLDELSTLTDTMNGEMKGELSGIKTVLDKLLEAAIS